MHSNGPTLMCFLDVRGRQFADLSWAQRVRRFGDRIAYRLSPTAGRRSHGGSDPPPKRGRINDEAHRGRARPHLAPSRRAGHRVRNVRIDAALRGHWERRGRRRRLSRLEQLRASSAGIVRVAFLGFVCLFAAAGQASADNGVYRRPIGNDPSTLDPAISNDIYGGAVIQQIFDGLVSLDQTLAITPSLAELWRASRDGLTWTFTLRKGVRFHHGREVTADDVVYSLTRVLDPRLKSGAADLFTSIRGAPEFRRGEAPVVSGLAALDRYTVKVSLTEASLPFVSVLAVAQAKIVPRELAERDPARFGLHPIGTGPFRFERWERGREIVLTANPEYFDGPPRLSRLVYRIFPGGQLDHVYEEFLKGELEDTQPPTRDYRRAISGGRHLYVRRPMFSLRFYGFNTRMKPFDDRRVRQAVVAAVDREAIIDEIHQGKHTLARGIVPPGTLGFNPALVAPGHDPERARALLAEAGYPGGRGLPKVEIWSSVTNDAIRREHELIRRSLAAVGIRAEFEYLTDWPAFTKALTEGRLPVFLYAWFADVPDPDNFVTKLFHSKSPRNYARYRNPVIDELLEAARATPDPHRRVDLFRRAEQAIVDDAVVLPVWHYSYERLFQPWVRSVEVNGLGDPYIPMRKVWLAR
jgi:peptide/nickel transport system substrate-binding protein/oligopeptide transport system substrate-binding protein